MKSLSIKCALGAAIFAGIAFAGIGMSSASQSAPAYHHGHHRRPPIARAMRAAHLSRTQHRQIRKIREEFRSSLTPGKRPTREQMKALRARVMGVLTPQQRTAVRQRLAQIRARRRMPLAPRPNATP